MVERVASAERRPTSDAVRCNARRVLLAGAALLSLALPALAADAPPVTYRLGIFPYLSPRQTVEIFGPAAADLEQALQRPVRLESAAGFREFTRAAAAGAYDVALIQPFDYPAIVERGGYLPLVRIAAPLVAQIYVRDDSPIQSIEQLRGGVLALPPAEAATARMTLHALGQHKLAADRDLSVRHFSSQDSCLQQVWIGAASGCGTARPPVLVFEQRMQAKLRAIYDTPALPHALFVVHPRVPAKYRAMLLERMIGWSHSESGRALLKSIGFPGFVVATPAEYAVMRNYDTAALASRTSREPGRDLTLGVFPLLSPQLLAKNFGAAQNALSRSIGANVRLRTTTTFDRFTANLDSASYDIVLVQPFDYARSAGRGYLPLAGMKQRLQGTFFVRDDSPYRTIADFRGTQVAMPPADSAVSRLGLHALIQAGLRPGRDVTIHYVKGHESCLQQVQSRIVQACSNAEFALPLLPKTLTQGLRKVGQTAHVPGVAFMAHERVPAATREQLRAEIVGWKDSDEGRKILSAVNLGEFDAVNVGEYLALPKLEGSR